MGLKQLPWGRPVKVERRFVEPYGEMNFRLLCENKREIRLVNIGGSLSELRWDSRVGIWTESKAPRMSIKAAGRKCLLLNE